MEGSLEMPMYAFTLSPSPEYIRARTPMAQFQELLPYICRMKQSCAGVITPELNLNGNIHFHGSILIKDKIKFYKHTLPMLKKVGFCLMRRIDDMSKWTEYIKKDIEVMKGILDLESLPLDLEKIKYRQVQMLAEPSLDHGILEYFPKIVCTIDTEGCTDP